MQPLLVLLLITHGAPSPVDAAASAYEALEFERCLALLATAAPEEAARAALYRGLCQYNLAQAAEAKASFREALRLSPTLSLPADVSPRISALFQSVREELARAAPPQQLVPKPPPEPQPVAGALVGLEQPAPRSYAGPALVGGAAVAAAVVATTFGILAKGNEARANGAGFTSDADGFARAGAQQAAAANVSWVVAGVALAVSGGWFGYTAWRPAPAP